MTIEFKGISYNIINNTRNLVEKLGLEHKEIPKEILASYRYYIIKA
jgi:hypothetical protein